MKYTLLAFACAAGLITTCCTALDPKQPSNDASMENGPESVALELASAKPSITPTKRLDTDVGEFTVYSSVFQEIIYGSQWARKIASGNVIVQKDTISPKRMASLPSEIGSSEMFADLTEKSKSSKSIERGYNVYGTLRFLDINTFNARLKTNKNEDVRSPRIGFALSKIGFNKLGTQALIFVEVFAPSGIEPAYILISGDEDPQKVTWFYNNLTE